MPNCTNTLTLPSSTHWPLVALDRKSTRLNSSHTEIYTLSLHDALPILVVDPGDVRQLRMLLHAELHEHVDLALLHPLAVGRLRSEEHTSELQSHRDLHSFPTRRSSDLSRRSRRRSAAPDASSCRTARTR